MYPVWRHQTFSGYSTVSTGYKFYVVIKSTRTYRNSDEQLLIEDKQPEQQSWQSPNILEISELQSIYNYTSCYTFDIKHVTQIRYVYMSIDNQIQELEN